MKMNVSSIPATSGGTKSSAIKAKASRSKDFDSLFLEMTGVLNTGSPLGGPEHPKELPVEFANDKGFPGKLGKSEEDEGKKQKETAAALQTALAATQTSLILPDGVIQTSTVNSLTEAGEKATLREISAAGKPVTPSVGLNQNSVADGDGSATTFHTDYNGKVFADSVRQSGFSVNAATAESNPAGIKSPEINGSVITSDTAAAQPSINPEISNLRAAAADTKKAAGGVLPERYPEKIPMGEKRAVEPAISTPQKRAPKMMEATIAVSKQDGVSKPHSFTVPVKKDSSEVMIQVRTDNQTEKLKSSASPEQTDTQNPQAILKPNGKETGTEQIHTEILQMGAENDLSTKSKTAYLEGFADRSGKNSDINAGLETSNTAIGQNITAAIPDYGTGDGVLTKFRWDSGGGKQSFKPGASSKNRSCSGKRGELCGKTVRRPRGEKSYRGFRFRTKANRKNGKWRQA